MRAHTDKGINPDLFWRTLTAGSNSTKLRQRGREVRRTRIDRRHKAGYAQTSMKVKIEYERSEIEKLLLEHHRQCFGEAPDGERWEATSTSYGYWEVENNPIPAEKEIP